MCLILLFLVTALFLISINVEFLAFIYLIIYIGAIAILFLFVIMMFNLKDLQYKVKKVNDFDFILISFPIYLFFLFKFYKLLSVNLVEYMEYNYSVNRSPYHNYFTLYG